MFSVPRSGTMSVFRYTPISLSHYQTALHFHLRITSPLWLRAQIPTAPFGKRELILRARFEVAVYYTA